MSKHLNDDLGLWHKSLLRVSSGANHDNAPYCFSSVSMPRWCLSCNVIEWCNALMILGNRMACLSSGSEIVAILQNTSGAYLASLKSAHNRRGPVLEQF